MILQNLDLGLNLQSHVNRAVMDSGVPLDSNLGNLSNHMSKYRLLRKMKIQIKHIHTVFNDGPNSLKITESDIAK